MLAATKLKISLKNPYVPWHYKCCTRAEIYVKGHAFVDGKFFNEKHLAEYIQLSITDSTFSPPKMKKFLARLNGRFAFVVKTNNYTWAAVDRMRSFPIFYQIENGTVHLGDMVKTLDENLQWDTYRCREYLILGYTTGNTTLLKSVKQLQAGEYLLIDHNESVVKPIRYYRFLHDSVIIKKYEQLVSDLAYHLKESFHRMLASTEDELLVVPLSGGWDSRLIVAMLKRYDVKNVVCFSYGVRGNPEMVTSKRVASVLGYPWYFVEYTRCNLAKAVFSEEMYSYWEYSGNLSSTPVISNWLAVKELKEKNVLKNKAIFIPGHSGDFLSGSHILPAIFQAKTCEDIVRSIIGTHYNRWDWKNALVDFKNHIEAQLTDLSLKNKDAVVSALEYWDWQERQAKHIINSDRLYEYWGYDWRVPLWDHELMDFYCQVPLTFRIKQRLYYKTIIDIIFKDKCEPLAHIPLANGLSPINMLERAERPLLNRYLIRIFLGKCRQKLFHFLYPKTNYINEVLLVNAFFSNGKNPAQTSVEDAFSAHYDKNSLYRECLEIMNCQWEKHLEQVHHIGMTSLFYLAHVMSNN